MNYRERLKESKTIVIKVGTTTITHKNGRTNLRRIQQLAYVIAELRNEGKDVVLVTSGAQGIGLGYMGFKSKPKDIRFKQAAASMGQATLVQIYKNFFNEYNQNVAQILLTKEDVKEGGRKETVARTFNTLLEMGVVPIVNANDAITTYEIEIADNDRLSAIVCDLVKADLLIILTDIDALYDSNPSVNKNAKRISVVEKVTDEVMAMASGKGSEFSSGGMETKLMAAKMCEKINTDVLILKGENPSIIFRAFDGEDVGTMFVGKN